MGGDGRQAWLMEAQVIYGKRAFDFILNEIRRWTSLG